MQIGDIYGFLKIDEFVSVEVDGKKIKTNVAKCECLRCGNKTAVNVGSLISGNTKSCGCLLKDVSLKKAMESITIVEGTCIESIRSKTIRKDNKTGVRGVNWNTSKKVWEATIGFKGKKYKRRFKNFDDAVKQRKLWEEEFYKPMIEKYS